MSNLSKNLLGFITPSPLKTYSTGLIVRHPFRIILSYLLGIYRGIPKVHYKIPVWFVLFCAGIAFTIFAASVSFKTYYELTKGIQASWITGQDAAWIATSFIALVIYFLANYAAGYPAEQIASLETKKRLTLNQRNYTLIGFITCLIVFAIIAGFDYTMSVKGGEIYGKESAGNFIQTPRNEIYQRYENDIQGQRDLIAKLEAKNHSGSCSKNGCPVVPGGAPHWANALTPFGKKAIRNANDKVAKLEAARANEIAEAEANTSRTNSEVAELQSFGKSIISGVAKFIYIVQFLTCFVAAVLMSLINHFIDQAEGVTYETRAAKKAKKDSSVSQSDAAEEDEPEPEPATLQNAAVDQPQKVIYKNRNFTKKDASKGRTSQAAKKQARAKRVRLLKSKGKSHSEIAKILGISIDTVRRDLKLTANQ